MKRNQGLFEKKLVSKRVLEEAETARANALSHYETAQKDVESQKKAVESEQETIDARKKALENRQTTLELHKKNLVTIKESQEAQRKQLAAELENAETRLQQILETTDEEKELTVHAKASAAAALLEADSTLKAQEERVDLDNRYRTDVRNSYTPQRRRGRNCDFRTLRIFARSRCTDHCGSLQNGCQNANQRSRHCQD